MILGFILMIGFFAWGNYGVSHLHDHAAEPHLEQHASECTCLQERDGVDARDLYCTDQCVVDRAHLRSFTPFAKIRMLKYRVESMTVIPAGNLDGFVADTAAEVSATSERRDRTC